MKNCYKIHYWGKFMINVGCQVNFLWNQGFKIKSFLGSGKQPFADILRIVFLKIWQNCLFCKVTGLRPASLLKRDSSTGAFLWILRNF